MAHSIVIRDLSKRYGKISVLKEIDLEINAGEFFTLLGPSGSGKTTLLMALAGFVRVESGSIRFDGTEVIRLPAHKRHVGVVFQNYALFPHMSVADNVGYPLWVRGLPKAERYAKVDEALNLVKLKGFGDRRISELSGGQKQRVALARAIVYSPSILLMDEPLSALDKNLREEMQVEIRGLQRRLGITTVFVTHDQREALTMSDRVAVMEAGSLVQIGSPREIYDTPRNRFVAHFIGDANILPVEVKEGRISLAGVIIDVTRASANGHGVQSLMLRPERLTLHRCAPQSYRNVLPATIMDVLFQGEALTVQLMLASGETIRVRGSSSAASQFEVGQNVHVAFHECDALVVGDD